MSALYEMRYDGQTGAGGGVIYVGHGIVAGADVGGGRYDGTVAEANGRLKLTATLSLPAGAMLVTGAVMSQATTLPLTADWPTDFANGQVQTIAVMGQPVRVTFSKIRDLP